MERVLCMGSASTPRRYEGFLKLGYLMPQYENTSMAILVNYTDHDQDSYYGARDYQARQRLFFLIIFFSLYSDRMKIRNILRGCPLISIVMMNPSTTI